MNEKKTIYTDLDLNENLVKNLGAPIDDNDAARKVDVDTKLTKLDYEYNLVKNFGFTGALCIGKFCMYDTNIVIDIASTTNIPATARIILASQNKGTDSGGSLVVNSYWDTDNSLTNSIRIYNHGKGDALVEIYYLPNPWSKNILHIKASALTNNGKVSYESAAFDIGLAVDKVPSEATLIPTNQSLLYKRKIIIVKNQSEVHIKYSDYGIINIGSLQVVQSKDENDLSPSGKVIESDIEYTDAEIIVTLSEVIPIVKLIILYN